MEKKSETKIMKITHSAQEQNPLQLNSDDGRDGHTPGHCKIPSKHTHTL